MAMRPDQAWRIGGAASQDKTLHFFEGLFHEVHNEPEREAVLSLWSDWLVERTA